MKASDLSRPLLVSAAVVLLSLLSACATVPAGHRGVLVYYLGTDKGVDSKEFNVGRYWIWPFSQTMYVFPVFQQNHVWSAADASGDRSISFQTMEGLSVNGDFGITYTVIADSVTVLFQTYRRGIDEITEIFLKNIVRDALNLAASDMGIEAVYGVGRQRLLLEADSIVRAQVQPQGIRLERLYTVGDLRMPSQVVRAINEKIEATQRAMQRENEVREAEAEAAKQVAKAKGESESLIIRTKADAEATVLRAKAEAEANTLRMQSLTPLFVQYETVKRWNGVLPTVTGGGTPLISLPDPR